MKKVKIYTDGACSFNPGPGGYCAILMYNGKEKVVSGAELETTNNRMELMAVIQGLSMLTEKCKVDLYSDSAYVCNAVNENWLQNWQLKNWKNSSKGNVVNRDLWEKLLELIAFHQVTFNKVKGHSDDELNNRCDSIARKEIAKILEKK